MGKYKIFKIKTIKDWEDEYWDVYEEYKTQAGIMVYKGWPYGETPQNGGQANFYYILSNEIAEYITQHSIVHITKTLGFSEPVVRRFRKMIGFFLSHPVTYNIFSKEGRIVYSGITNDTCAETMLQILRPYIPELPKGKGKTGTYYVYIRAVTPYWLFEDFKKIGIPYKVYPNLDDPYKYTQDDPKKLIDSYVSAANEKDRIKW